MFSKDISKAWEIAESLLSWGVSVNDSDFEGTTIIGGLIKKGYWRVLLELLWINNILKTCNKEPFNLQIECSSKRFSPIYFALEMREVFMAEDLFESGASCLDIMNFCYMPREWKRREYSVRKNILRKMEWFEYEHKFKSNKYF